jgi:hemoglobin/transferrin/lactoferrin receptor protein
MSTRVAIFILVSVLWFNDGMSQIIQVLEENSLEPISGSAVYNLDKSKSGITDFDGYVDISDFSDSENIYFQHISHTQTFFTKSDIITSGNVVYLTMDASTLDEVVLAISKFGLRKKDLPQQVVTVTSDDIRLSNPQTAADLLESSGQVYVQKSQLGGGSPLIRGFSTNRLLITIDGIRFNTAIFRSGNVQNIISIDPFSIENTEVILGPGSVVYGSDAIGGVMNFYTKRPKFSFEEGLDFSGNAVVRYSSANEEKTGHIDINIGAKEWAFLTSISYSEFGDLKMGKYGPDDYLRTHYVETINGVDTVISNPDPRVQVPTGYHQINAMQKIRFMPSKNWDFDLGLFYSTTGDYPRYDRLIQKRDDYLRASEWYYGPQEWIAGNLFARNMASGNGLYNENIITLSYQRFKEGRNNRDFGESILFETDETIDALSLAWDFEKKFGSSNTFFYGIEYVHNTVDSEGKQTDITSGISNPDASRYPDGATWKSIAGYSSLQLKFTEKLAFQGGLRYNHIYVDATFDDRFFNFPFSEAKIRTGALTGSAGFSFTANDILGLKSNFSSAFRAPNIDDVGKIFDSEPGSVVVPNPDLKHETAYNWEVGATLNFEDVVKLDVVTYYTMLHDALVRRDFNLNGETEIEYQGELSNVQAIQNAGRAKIYGLEAGLEVNFSKELKLKSQFNITDGYQDEDGNKLPVRHAVPQFGNTHLKFTKNKWKFDAYAVYNGQFDYQDLAPSQQNNAYLYAKDENGNPYSPRWYTLNFRAQYSLLAGLQLTTTLENITNQRYRTYSSGITSPGTNLIIAASYDF